MSESAPPGEPASSGRVGAGRAAPHPVAGGVSLLVALVGGALLTALVSGLDETYEDVREHSGLARIDQPMLDWMVAHRSPVLDQVVTWFTDIGGALILTPLTLVVVLVLAWRWHSWTPLVLMLVATAGSLAMTEAGKDITDRARPPHTLAVPPYENSPSFPSGHTLNSTVIAAILAYLVVLFVENRWRRVVVITLLALYAAAIGMSRVFLGHHWFTDVVAGWLAGLAWAIVVIAAHRILLWLQARRASALVSGSGSEGAPTRIR